MPPHLKPVPRARKLHLLKLKQEPALRNKRSHHSEMPAHSNEDPEHPKIIN